MLSIQNLEVSFVVGDKIFIVDGYLMLVEFIDGMGSR